MMQTLPVNQETVIPLLPSPQLGFAVDIQRAVERAPLPACWQAGKGRVSGAYPLNA